MGEKQLNIELKKHLDDVISSRKEVLENTEIQAMEIWNLICNRKDEHSSRRVVVEHYNDGNISISFYDSNKSIIEKLSDHCSDYELIPFVAIIAGNSDINGKCRLSDNGFSRRLQLDFK